MTKKRDKKTTPAPIVSGSYQVVSERERKDLEELQNNDQLDEESLHYARIFMED